jgi:hypothetical protein
MNPTYKKWIKPLSIFAFLIAALAAVTFVVVSTQQERIVNLALREINKQFKGELTVAESQISLFKNFPYVSVALHDVRFLPDKTGRAKPISNVDHLYVGFRLTDLLQQHYSVKILFVEGGYLNLVRDNEGRINLLEAEANPAESANQNDPGTPDDSTGAMAVDLKKIILKDLAVSFLDNETGQMVSTRIDKILSSFKMDSTSLAVAAEGDMRLDLRTNTDSTFFHDKQVHVNILADYHQHSGLFQVTLCKLKLEEAGFTVTGSANTADTTVVDFKVTGDERDFDMVTAFLPKHLNEKLKPFQYDGQLHFDALIKGKVAEGVMPLIQVFFGCEEAWVLNTGANKKLDKVGFKGYYTNGSKHSLETSEVHIVNVSARPEKGIFQGHFVVRDFINPKAVVQINSELELKFLGEFLGIEDLKQITGKIRLDMNFKELHDITLPEESLNKLKEGIQSKLVIENLSFRIPGYPHAVRDMNVRAEMKDGRVTVDSATIRIGKSDIEFSGSISDVKGFLRDRHNTMHVALRAASKQLMLSDLLSYDTALARKWKEEVHDFNVALKLETTAHELMHPDPLPRGTFEMKNLRGTFKEYAHTFKDLGATVLINDTLLRLRDFTGMIDSSDINFKGRVINYHLWFDDVKKGRTQIAFDFKSNRFALKDVLGREIRQHLPRGYRREILTNVWLRSKIDLKYDTNFRFAKAKVSNITANLTKHKVKLTEISGGVKYGSKILSFDTLRGKIGNSDFDISLKYYFKGIDRRREDARKI